MKNQDVPTLYITDKNVGERASRARKNNTMQPINKTPSTMSAILTHKKGTILHKR